MTNISKWVALQASDNINHNEMPKNIPWLVLIEFFPINASEIFGIILLKRYLQPVERNMLHTYYMNGLCLYAKRAKS